MKNITNSFKCVFAQKFNLLIWLLHCHMACCENETVDYVKTVDVCPADGKGLGPFCFEKNLFIFYSEEILATATEYLCSEEFHSKEWQPK